MLGGVTTQSCKMTMLLYSMYNLPLTNEQDHPGMVVTTQNNLGSASLSDPVTTI
jgi:hypothetical protein